MSSLCIEDATNVISVESSNPSSLQGDLDAIAGRFNYERTAGYAKLRIYSSGDFQRGFGLMNIPVNNRLGFS